MGSSKNDDDDEATLVNSPATSDPSTTDTNSITVRPIKLYSENDAPVLSTPLTQTHARTPA